MSPHPPTPAPPTAPPSIRLPGIILGVGLGGFVDGILLHQILQWHHMLTSTNTDRVGIAYYPADTVHGLRMNTLWDGVFHTFTWLCVLVGLAILYSRVEHSRGRVWTSRALWGLVLFGWGLFNVVEGLAIAVYVVLRRLANRPIQPNERLRNEKTMPSKYESTPRMMPM